MVYVCISDLANILKFAVPNPVGRQKGKSQVKNTEMKELLRGKRVHIFTPGVLALFKVMQVPQTDICIYTYIHIHIYCVYNYI